MSSEENVMTTGSLSGGDYQRQAKVRTTRKHIYEDEVEEPVRTLYLNTRIADTDDFPDGEYMLEFEGGQVQYSRRNGEYMARR